MVTFVRSDVPAGWTPPAGSSAVPVAELPEGWEWETPPNNEPQMLAPITKLTLKTRVTPQEWGAIKAAIAGASEDIQEDWTLAKEIDPQHPQTAAMIAALQGAGYLTTPLHVIFAP